MTSRSPVLERVALVNAGVAALSLVVTLVVWGATALREESGQAPVASASPASAPGSAASSDDVPLGVLRDWDRRRSRAWARGSATGLADLYTRGSRTGRRDVAMLRAYAERGLRVTGMQVQLLEVDAVEADCRRLVLDVVDRLTGAVAVGDGVRRPLPADGASRRRVELRLVDGGWLVHEVRQSPRGQ